METARASSTVRSTGVPAMDLNAVVRALAPALRETLGLGVELVLDLSPTLEPVRLDRLQLEGALLVVAQSRWGYAGSARTMTIDTAMSDAEWTGRHAARHPDVVLSVIDDGRGLSDAGRARLLAAYLECGSRAPQRSPHRGGLHDAVRRAGGCIEVQSSPGGPIAFVVRVPALSAD